MIRKIASYAVAFLRWYWARVVEFPKVFCAFCIGGAYCSILVESPRLAQLILQRLT